MNNLIGSAAEFAKKIEIDPEVYFTRHHYRHLQSSCFGSVAQSQTKMSLYQFYRWHLEF